MPWRYCRGFCSKFRPRTSDQLRILSLDRILAAFFFRLPSAMGRRASPLANFCPASLLSHEHRLYQTALRARLRALNLPVPLATRRLRSYNAKVCCVWLTLMVAACCGERTFGYGRVDLRFRNRRRNFLDCDEDIEGAGSCSYVPHLLRGAALSQTVLYVRPVRTIGRRAD